MVNLQPISYNVANVFSRILRGEIPCHKIFETSDCLAILDAFPTVRGHSLLLPKYPAVNLLDMPDHVAEKVFKELPRLTQAVKKATNADGISVVSNNGSAAGQVVFHSHIHIIPRFDGDQLGEHVRIGGKLPLNDQDAHVLLAKIKEHLRKRFNDPLEQKQNSMSESGSEEDINCEPLLTRRLRDIWIAGHFVKRFHRSEIRALDLSQCTKEIRHLALSTSLKKFSGLLIGVVNLYVKQIDFFLQDCFALFRRLVNQVSCLFHSANTQTKQPKRIAKHSGKKSWRIQTQKQSNAKNVGYQLPSTHTQQASPQFHKGISNTISEQSLSCLMNEPNINRTENIVSLQDLLQHTTQSSLGVKEPLTSTCPDTSVLKLKASEKLTRESDSLTTFHDVALEELGIASLPLPQSTCVMPQESSHDFALVAQERPFDGHQELFDQSLCEFNQSPSFTPYRNQNQSPLPTSNSPSTYSESEHGLLVSQPRQVTLGFSPSLENQHDSNVHSMRVVGNFLEEDTDEMAVVLILSESADEDDHCDTPKSMVIPPVVRRYHKSQSRGGIHVDEPTQLDEEIFQEWEGSISALLRPEGLCGWERHMKRILLHQTVSRGVEHLYRRRGPIDKVASRFTFARKSPEATNTKLMDIEDLDSASINCAGESDLTLMYDTIPRSKRSPESYNNLNISPSKVQNHDFSWEEEEERGLQVMDDLKMAYDKSKRPRNHYDQNVDNSHGAPADLYQALYATDCSYDTQGVSYNRVDKTPLKTPLAKWLSLNKTATTPDMTYSGHSTYVGSAVNEEFSDLSDNFSCSSLTTMQLKCSQTPPKNPPHHSRHDSSSLNDSVRLYSIPCSIETPIQPPGVGLGGESLQDHSKVYETGLFCFSSAPPKIQHKLCHEVGFSLRTLRVLEHLGYFLSQQNTTMDSQVKGASAKSSSFSFKHIVKNQVATTVAATFSELLNLKSRLFIDLKPSNSTADKSLSFSVDKSDDILISFDTRYYDFCPPYTVLGE